jgi:F-type H+-transporting ATPase subunit delta
MSIANISKRYAKGLIQLVKKEMLLPVLEDYNNFLTVLNNKKNNVALILDNPAFSMKDKQYILNFILHNKNHKCTKIFCNFVFLLMKNRRIKYADSIFKIYEDHLDTFKNQINVDFITHVKIDKNAFKNIICILEKSLKKNVKSNFIVDSKIIGGIKIKIGNYLLNDCIKSKLANLQKSLININL